MDKVIFSTKNFTVKTPQTPHIPREDGGHIFIEANDHSIAERSQLSPSQTIELAWIVSITGKAYWKTMPTRGLDLYRLNYQDNGNWSFIRGEAPVLHVHIYGRTRNETHQEFGQALYLPYSDTGFYDGFTPLDEEDITALRTCMENLAATNFYKNWDAAIS